jgi:hypothetical protein
MLSRSAAAPLIAVLALLLAACGVELSDTPPEPTEDQRMSQQAELADRPTLETMIARYEEMQQRIRDRLDAELGPFPWRIANDGSRGGCPNFLDTDGESRMMPLWLFDGTIADGDWPRAAAVVQEITAEYGFETSTLAVDRPGYHKVSGADLELGAQYDFTAAATSGMQVTTGCHLPESIRGPA